MGDDHFATNGDMGRLLTEVIGAQQAKLFAENLGLTTFGDILDYFPRKLVPRGQLSSFDELELEKHATLVAEVVSVNTRKMRHRKGSITEVVITDRSEISHDRVSTGTTDSVMTLSFFNAWTAARELPSGTHALFSGKVTLYKGKKTMSNPRYALLDPSDNVNTHDVLTDADAPIAVYPATAKLPSERIAAAAAIVLNAMDWATVSDPLPPDVVRARGYTDLSTAYHDAHMPADEPQWYRAKARFRYTEALVLQTALMRRRRMVAARPALALTGGDGQLLRQLDAQLPFELTPGQKAVGECIACDLAQNHPMNRLVQGDVGAGKTVVALRAMVQAVDSGAQAVLLAPTEVLATQHYFSVQAMMGSLAQAGMLGGELDGTRVVLLTGSMSQSARKKALLEIASGEAGIVIGTHALLSETVHFFRLGLVVVDEQHRFGVEQRDRLRETGNGSAHLLVMTATPIPRTVAMTVFGDLDVSVLEGLPGGRQPITTHVVGLREHPAWEGRIFQRAREEVDAGHQVYFVAPKIGDDSTAEDDGMASAISVQQQVAECDALEGVASAVLHGRLDSAEKSATMEAFAHGEISVLVATTVIEVGVDVANATLMVIFDADRFGISQLHQLRGRIGRGDNPGTCLLVTRCAPDHPSRQRLDAVAATTDGFELANMDLALRREGDILGDAQSGGRSTLRLLRALDDAALIGDARSQAEMMLNQDPELLQHRGLAMAIDSYLDEDTEKYLERG